METLNFKTTIKCSVCVSKVTPHLNEAVGEGNWEVNLTNPSKILTVKGEMAAIKITEALEKIGYRAEKI